uniref:Putative Fanconi anemia group M protein n=1 Tax=Actinia equina TaxID=6106 RepID=A0A6C0WV95_ACTEQ|nr:putative Fanconi anemia group M protein [Actinia equina]
MKKGNPNQKTLFQSWGKNGQQTLKTTEERKTHNHSDNIPIEIIDLEDDDEDDGLLAAALEMESIDPQMNQNGIQNSNCAGNVSNSETSEEPKEVEYLPGFDMESGNVWIYPTNYPIRDYQFQIVQKSLFMNTLVTLPTGLGKTFIAAVLMYNYYRWYPQGKVIFMAPTKPLVAQQIEACYNIMGIPESDTAQMTGNMAPNKREVMWKNKRVFFLTPQVLQNDLSRGSCCPEGVVLLVFDEAHKALGNHAYCQVVREISNYTRNFRVLALSATPGDDVKAVQQVMTNLLISHMELRSEDSSDIQPFTHSRTVDKIVVPLGDDISRIKIHFLKVLEGIVGRLFCNRALWQKDPQRVTKYMLLSGRDQFRKRNLEGYTNGQKGAIEGDFAMAISLYHAYELLHQHGILSFYNFIKAIIDGSKGMVRAKTEIKRNKTSALFSQFTSPRRRAMHKQPFDPSFKSHPKLLKLEEVIVEHFQKFSSEAASTSTSVDNESVAESKQVAAVNTRVMIFSQYRDSVGEITAILNKHKPLVRVMSFIGQASTGKSSRGLSQKEQLERFRRGGYNTLVATCVGEEGLDIGDVDLIVCFDAHASPIRLVQRMGRTGRKRNGRIVVLVSEGKEEQVYKRSLSNKKSIHKAIVQGSKSFELYDDNPRMIPRHLMPRVLKMQMTVGDFVGNRYDQIILFFHLGSQG